MNPIERVVRRADTYQQHHRIGFVFGVVKKFGDDRAGSLAALIAYYGFLSLFPLLLLLVTVLGFVVQHNPDLQHRLLHSALADFPIIGDQISKNVHSLRATGLGLVISIVGLAWGSLGFTQAAQHAMAEVWNVPGVHRPGFLPRLGRGTSIIGVLGVGAIATTLVSGIGVSTGTAAVTLSVTVLASVALNVAIGIAAFRLLTPKVVPTRELLPGAVLAGLAWSALQLVGGYLVSHQLRNMSQVYGLFAIVLGLMFWLYLGAQISLYAAELNVVLARRLYPRSIVQPPLTEPDRQALRDLAGQEERRPEERVRVDFVDEDAAPVRPDPRSRRGSAAQRGGAPQRARVSQAPAGSPPSSDEQSPAPRSRSGQRGASPRPNRHPSGGR